MRLFARWGQVVSISFKHQPSTSKTTFQEHRTDEQHTTKDNPHQKGYERASANRAATYEKLDTFSMLMPARIFVTFQPNTSTARRDVRWEKLLIDRILEYEISQKL